MVEAVPVAGDGIAVGSRTDTAPAAPGHHFADAPEGQLEVGGDAADGQALVGGGGKAEFVVVAAGQLAIEGEGAGRLSGSAPWAGGALDGVHRRRQAGTVGDVAEVGEQPVGNVDGGAGDADGNQPRATRGRGCSQGGEAKPPPGFGQDDLALELSQAQGRQARAAGTQMSSPGRAPSGVARPGRHFAQSGDAQVQGAAGGVAADHVDAAGRRHRRKPSAKAAIRPRRPRAGCRRAAPSAVGRPWRRGRKD